MCCQVELPPPVPALQCPANACDYSKGICGPDTDDEDDNDENEDDNDIERRSKSILVSLTGRSSRRLSLPNYPSRGQLYRNNRGRVVTHNYFDSQPGPCPAVRINRTRLNVPESGPVDPAILPTAMETEHVRGVRRHIVAHRVLADS